MKILILLIVFTLYNCDLTDNSPDISATYHKTVHSNGIEFSLNIYKNIFLLNDTLTISLKVKNYSSSAKTFNFSNIQQLGYQIIDQNNKTAAYYPNIASPALSHFSVGPGEMKELNQNGIFKDNNGRYINRGIYSLVVYLLDNNSPELRLEISVI